jgi:hypothetical protein
MLQEGSKSSPNATLLPILPAKQSGYHNLHVIAFSSLQVVNMKICHDDKFTAGKSDSGQEIAV